MLLKDHNAVTLVRLEPAALRSQVKHSTTEPLRSQKALNRDRVLNQACRLSRDIKVISNPFKLITKIRVFNHSFEFIN